MAIEEGLPRWIAGLSVDGWMQVLYAFGLLKSEWTSLRPKELSQCLPSVEAQDVVSRGFGRLQELEASTSAYSENLGAVVARIPLINLMVCPTGPQDQAVGLQLFQRIFGHGELNDVIRKHPELGQLDLFGEPLI